MTDSTPNPFPFLSFPSLSFPLSPLFVHYTHINESNLLTETPEIRNWLLGVTRSKERVVVGAYAYLDGARFVKIAVAMDAIMRDLQVRACAITLLHHHALPFPSSSSLSHTLTHSFADSNAPFRTLTLVLSPSSIFPSSIFPIDGHSSSCAIVPY